MSKFNKAGARTAATSAVRSEARPSGRTFEGAAGYARDHRSELFLLAVSNKVGDDTFYEQAKERDDRFSALVHLVAIEDPQWTARFLAWLRAEANMRSASLVGAAEYVRARLGAPENGLAPANRQVIDSVLRRADEPGEMLAYWTSKYGRRLPQPVKRGVGDAVRRLYNERALLKYDTDSKAFRFGDVIELVHPAPEAGKVWQGELFRHSIDRRHRRAVAMEELGLATIAANHRIRALAKSDPAVLLDAESLRTAAMTWEDALSLAGNRVEKAKLWEALIPSMGIFALVRNLRNFDQAGVSDTAAELVRAKLTDPEVIARSRMFPFRFWAAYKHTDSLRWAAALEKALELSLANVPALPGRTLVLVDRSPSMFPGYSFSTPNTSDITLAEQAAVFGAALALRAKDATLVEFGMRSKALRVPRGGSVLKLVERFGRIDGTDIPSAVKQHFGRHDRIVVVTDEQTRPGWLPSNCGGYKGMPETKIDDLVPANVPLYMWNMAGYKHGAAPSGGELRHTFGGLSDQAFRLIPLLEAGRDADWPF